MTSVRKGTFFRPREKMEQVIFFAIFSDQKVRKIRICARTKKVEVVTDLSRNPSVCSTPVVFVDVPGGEVLRVRFNRVRKKDANDR